MRKVLLVGNPNVGKSTLFNSITKSNAHTGNFHGVTVEESKKVVKINNKAIDKTITADETLGGYIYHITITREMYESYGTGTDIDMCYTLGDTVNNSYQPSTFFYVDNLALVKQ